MSKRADSSELWTRYKQLARHARQCCRSRATRTRSDKIAANEPDRRRIRVSLSAHAPMEPLNTTVRFDGDRAEVWAGSQFQTVDQMAVAEVLGLKPEQVTFHTRWPAEALAGAPSPTHTYNAKRPTIAKRLRGTPVKLVWTREDDVQGGYYRPMHFHRVEVGIGADGLPAAWRHVIVGQSLLMGTPFESFAVKNGVDHTAVEGVADTHYNIPQLPRLGSSSEGERARALVALGRAHAHRVCDGDADRRAGARARMDPIAYRRKLLKPEAKKLPAALDLLEARALLAAQAPEGHALGFPVTSRSERAWRAPSTFRSRTSVRRFIARRSRSIAVSQ